MGYVNCDEALIYMEIVSNKNIEIKGSKDIDISTFGGDKVKVSLLLSCEGNGKKLLPLLVLKATMGRKLEKALNKFKIVKEKKYLFVARQMHGVTILYLYIGLKIFIYLIKIMKLKKHVYLIWIKYHAIALNLQ